ncbi:NUDIX domain-containing protein [Amycolatopsis sp.]|uniref:NUDIX domain-containing protein n=1 Tax=Amycolatopsis sp. TaxID=37632 RepID=UPI0039C8A5AD
MRRDGTDYGRKLLAFPAGHVDPGETVTACALRETAEELALCLIRAICVLPA